MAAAQIAIAGMDPLTFLRTKEPFERAAMQAVAAAAIEMNRKVEQRRAEFLASEIIRRLVIALGKK